MTPKACTKNAIFYEKENFIMRNEVHRYNCNLDTATRAAYACDTGAYSSTQWPRQQYGSSQGRALCDIRISVVMQITSRYHIHYHAPPVEGASIIICGSQSMRVILYSDACVEQCSCGQPHEKKHAWLMNKFTRVTE